GRAGTRLDTAAVDPWTSFGRRRCDGDHGDSAGAVSLDPRRRRHHVDRPPVLLQLRERPLRRHARRRREEDGRAAAAAAGPLLVPLLRTLDMGDGRTARACRLLPPPATVSSRNTLARRP